MEPNEELIKNLKEELNVESSDQIFWLQGDFGHSLTIWDFIIVLSLFVFEYFIIKKAQRKIRGR